MGIRVGTFILTPLSTILTIIYVPLVLLPEENSVIIPNFTLKFSAWFCYYGSNFPSIRSNGWSLQRSARWVDHVWNLIAHAQKPDLVFPPKRTCPFESAGGGRQFSRLLRSRGVHMRGSNAEYTVFRGSVKGTGFPLHSAVVMLDTPCSEVVWRVLATHCIQL